MFDARYAARDIEGNVCETFEQAVHRLASAAASAESKDQSMWYDRFKQILIDLLFIPSTPIWANIGKDDRDWQPSACFVLAVEDSLNSMYEVLMQTALIFKSGGGTGYNFSTIRPKGDLVNSTKGKASGVVELIKLYNSSADMVMQGGVRRGASIGILNIDHPEIEGFIKAKMDGGLTNFNISVGISTEFMQALKSDGDWPLKFGNKTYKICKALDLWNMIVDCAHACGDPGLIFIDNLQDSNPMFSVKLTATNPCGEQPLAPGESCLLGSINLAKVKPNTPNFETVIEYAVRFLDNMIDIATYPLDVIDKATRDTRKIGLGYTGLADALIYANLAYDSEEGRQYAKFITGRMSKIAMYASMRLANEKGNFPAWENSVYYPDTPMRNATRVTIAPTGSVTAMAGCEGYGVEPLFALAYKKATNVAGDFEVLSQLFVDACLKLNVHAEHILKVAELGTCQNVDGIPLEIQRIFKGAQEIAPKDHLLMQAAVQEKVDNAVSKTINLPSTATWLDVNDCYSYAHSLHLKGITIFRDGCKQGTITVGKKDINEIVRPRPQSAIGETFCLRTGCGKLYLTINHENEKILEVFVTTGSAGGCLIYSEATSRLISLAVRGNIPVELIVEQLKSTHSCSSFMYAKGRGIELAKGSSCPSVIANQLKSFLSKLKNRQDTIVDTDNGTPKCDVCGAQLLSAEGCFVCTSCGYSKC